MSVVTSAPFARMFGSKTNSSSAITAATSPNISRAQKNTRSASANVNTDIAMRERSSIVSASCVYRNARPPNADAARKYIGGGGCTSSRIGSSGSVAINFASGRMLGVNAEVAVFPVRIAGVDVRAFVEGLGVLSHREEKLGEEHDEQQRGGNREPTPPNTAGEHGNTPTE